ncbi:hypothetical protein KSS87_015458 [Heliosperma pusillum]|nr:hypothetical protein KSS87_004428 [Heliosperma pusillum]KAH9612757.1 hypothetical protein KSS87_015458 [Heliosperma pusillum]
MVFRVASCQCRDSSTRVVSASAQVVSASAQVVFAMLAIGISTGGGRIATCGGCHGSVGQAVQGKREGKGKEFTGKGKEFTGKGNAESMSSDRAQSSPRRGSDDRSSRHKHRSRELDYDAPRSRDREHNRESDRRKDRDYHRRDHRDKNGGDERGRDSGGRDYDRPSDRERRHRGRSRSRSPSHTKRFILFCAICLFVGTHGAFCSRKGKGMESGSGISRWAKKATAVAHLLWLQRGKGDSIPLGGWGFCLWGTIFLKLDSVLICDDILCVYVQQEDKWL